MKEIVIGKLTIGNDRPFLLIAGPCSIESEQLVMETASTIREITHRLGIPYIFKSSFDKANRTSIHSYRGPGIHEGLRILNKVKSDLEIPVLTDIHLPEQAKEVSDVADVLQIPAFLCRQTDLIVAAAETQKPGNVKKAQFLAPWEMNYVIDKFKETGNDKVMLCERGSCFGYNNLVVDMTSMVEMKKTGYPVVFDVTHSVQKPGGKGNSSGGNREYIKDLSRAGIAMGIAGIFIEVHPDPDKALSDGSNMVKLQELEPILKKLQEIDGLIKEK